MMKPLRCPERLPSQSPRRGIGSPERKWSTKFPNLACVVSIPSSGNRLSGVSASERAVHGRLLVSIPSSGNRLSGEAST